LETGEEHHRYSVHITPIGTAQHINGHLVILHDDTERMKAEIESRTRAILETELNERKTSGRSNSAQARI